ncbi:MAG TPA: phospholipase D-like domain-containing protein [Syntrophorhabdaceae bacterium]|nr:phospholipase D-like domain-containing protein [Syntrophorhabdaceae bacterium]
MPAHDIIDNRNEKLVDHINLILGSTEAARFAVGYFFLSGFTSIAERLSGIKELYLLIGNTTNRETLEQIAEGYRRLELVAEAAEAEKYPKRTESKRIAADTGENIRTGIELMDQTDEGEDLVRNLVRMIEEKRLKVRIYTKGRLHAKAYIFDYGKVFDEKGKQIERHEKGIAIVGSSNLTLSGVTHNTELNVLVQGNDNHAELVKWFEALWKEAQDFDEALMQEMKQSWAMVQVKPYDIYMKTLYSLVRDKLEGEDDRDILWDDEIVSRLADFQKVAVRQAVQIIRDYSGVFISDVVGLGKSYIGAAIVKHFERTDHARPLIICPAPLVDMWERYNEVYQLNARVLSMGYLRENDNESMNMLFEDVRFKDRDFLLIDESHNFCHPDTQRYKIMQGFLSAGKHCCFLTATPRNKSAWDVYHQIKLFHQEDRTYLPIDPPNLKDYFKKIEARERKMPDLLSNILIRRTRNHILRWYGFDATTHQPLDPSRFKDYLDGKKRAYVIVAGKHQFFPKRELETVEYSIEDTYQGLYQELRGYMGKPRKGQPVKPSPNELTYARYGLWHYVKKERQKEEPYASLHRAGANLRGLIRVLLFKRFESSVEAFRQSVRKLLIVHERFLKAISEGFVPAGDDAQAILYEPNQEEEQDLMDALRKVSGKYIVSDFDIERLKEHIEHDIELFKTILHLVEPITAEQDAKLQRLLAIVNNKPLNQGKRLIFTQYADTARYLYGNLNPGDVRDDIDVIFSGDKSKARVVGRFAPKANPEYRFAGGEAELMTVVATDVLAEGLNLQDCDKIVNYDLHWNPVRLIQRFGRIDRIGSDHDVIYGFNFLPETGIERNLKLKEKLRLRIQEIHDTIGEDSAILDSSEQLNEEAMYAIYEKNSGQLSLFEDEGEEILDLNEAEEILRQLRKENQNEYDRIVSLRDGIRTVKPSENKGLFVFCQAGRYQQLFLLDDEGNIISRDIPRILGVIKCGQKVRGLPLPDGYNRKVMRILSQFKEEVKHREAEREHTLSLSHGQRYVIRELRVLFGIADDEDMKGRINLLERTFRGAVPKAIDKELNKIRRNGITGQNLLRILGELYSQYGMRDWLDHKSLRFEEQIIPKIVCSEGLG